MKIYGIEITHPDKILYPEERITKGQVAEYYNAVAPRMIPHLKERPLSLHRFPSGTAEKGFYQKNVSDYFPDFIKRVEVETEEGSNIQMLCNNKRSLIYLVNQNTLSFHTWLSKADRLRQPNRIVFDLDPPRDSFEQVKEAAYLVRDFLVEKRRAPKVMTTGQQGLHVYYKISRRKDFDAVKEEVREMAEEMEQRHPKVFTTQLRKDRREGKIFLDYLRNAYAQTAVCPYSLRPNAAAGVAFPLNWEELEGLRSADAFSLRDQLI